jgi:hypothetical protein
MRVKTTIVALVVSAGALTACGGSERWCEFDSTDQVVADSFCKVGTPGYEWETGSKPGTVKRDTVVQKRTNSGSSSTRKK